MPPAAEANVEKCFAFTNTWILQTHTHTHTIKHKKDSRTHSNSHRPTKDSWDGHERLRTHCHLQDSTTYKQTDSTTRAHRGGRRGGRRKGPLSCRLPLGLWAVGVRVRTYACERTLRSHPRPITHLSIFTYLDRSCPCPCPWTCPCLVPCGTPPSPPTFRTVGLAKYVRVRVWECGCVCVSVWTKAGVLLPKCSLLPSFLFGPNTVARN